MFFCVFFVTVFIYLPSLKNGFTVWDDPHYVTDNLLIKNFSFSAAGKIITSFHCHLYKPLVLLSFLLEYHFFKLDPFGYHMVSLIIHLLNCLLVFWFIVLISRSSAVSFFTALFFAVHPLHVESVAWIAERKDLLCAFFFFLAFIMYFYYRRCLAKRFYFLSLVFFVLSLLAKPQGIIFPFLLCVFDVCRGKRAAASLILDKVPYLLLAVSIALLNFHGLRSSLAAGGTLSFSFDSFLVACRGILFYIGKIFVPIKLSCFYPYPQKWDGLLPLAYRLSPIGVVLLALLVLWTGKYTKKIIFGSLFFLFMLLPVLPLAPFSPGISAADRYTYISSVGIFYILAEFFVFLYKRKFKQNRIFRMMEMFLLGCIVGILCFLTFDRGQIWKNDVTLWSDVLKNDPSAATAHLNLATAYLGRGDYDNALYHAGEVLRLDPAAWDSYLLTGNILLFKKDLDKALLYYLKAVQLRPCEAKIYNNIGRVYYAKGEDGWGRAADYYKKAIRLDPAFYGPYFNLGLIYESTGQRRECLKCFIKASELNPDSTVVLWRLANSYIQDRSDAEAVRVFERLIGLEPLNARTWSRIGLMLAGLSYTREAEIFLKQALVLDRSNVEAMAGLADLYGNLGRWNEAIDYFQKALILKPDDEKLKKDLEYAFWLRRKA